MRTMCDLHTHSTFSDGTWAPEAIVAEADRMGLRAVALCDHNTIGGLSSFLAAGGRAGVEAVPGTELSVDCGEKELHLLGLWLPPESYGPLNAFLADGLRRKEESNLELAAALNARGYRVDLEAIRQQSPGGNINRALFARQLVERGYFPTVAACFETVLSESGGLYRRPPRPNVLEAIAFLRSLGAVPVLAHPFLQLTAEELRAFLPEAKACGLVGMETHYPRYDRAASAAAAAIAEAFGLCTSGGSDFHGEVKPDIPLGCAGISPEELEALRWRLL